MNEKKLKFIDVESWDVIKDFTFLKKEYKNIQFVSKSRNGSNQIVYTFFVEEI
jgi:hypothetical protein